MKPPSLHYHFTYKVLPYMFFNRYRDLVKYVNLDPHIINQVLTNLWCELANDGTPWENPTLITPSDSPHELAFYAGLLKGEGADIFCVRMPKATMPLEAAMVAVVLDEQNPRYFTCERSMSCYMVGEIFNREDEPTRMNYGPVADGEEFIKKVMEIIKR